ncbi:predicted protein [Naegleria gruberi]|uniref:Predicted protein n=1 Tax=Naegleria gruberi TaxID=5762 RepID=D2VS61_NAEGR|nr:uncharacterized protein NAEGRDRAFT_71824 [Naegleria gruberi]EFC40369.1 predicted protein [Naegleria gruberi]|eukprot:XP_002673113.1 predicted protein [Naegleria gruberi strain NEG-M]
MSLLVFHRNSVKFFKFSLLGSNIKSNKTFSNRISLISKVSFSTFDKKAATELSDKGALAFANKNYEEALKFFLQAKEACISLVVILRVANCYERLNDRRGAFHEYQIIIRFYENSLDETRRAMSSYQECYVMALIGAGRNNYLNSEEAMEYWRKASQFKNIPNHILGNSLIAGLYYQKGKYREAIQYYTKSIQELEGTTEYSDILNASDNYFFKGMSHVSLDEPELAIQDFSRLINEYRDGTNPDSILNDNENRSMAYMNRGLCYCALENFELGFKDLEDSLIECDSDVNIIYAVAQAYYIRYTETGSNELRERSIHFLNKILEIDPKHFKSQQFLMELAKGEHSPNSN